MARRRKPDPRQTATEILDFMRSRADAKKATSYQRFFKEPVTLFGIDGPTMHSIERDLLKNIGNVWTIRDAVSFCRAMIRDPHLEARGVGFLIVAHFVNEGSPDLLPTIKRWLERSCRGSRPGPIGRTAASTPRSKRRQQRR